jgi:hypothetical protein
MVAQRRVKELTHELDAARALELLECGHATAAEQELATTRSALSVELATARSALSA